METALAATRFIDVLHLQTDAIRKIGLDTFQMKIRHDTITPGHVDTVCDLTQCIRFYPDNGIDEVDCEKCHVDLSSGVLKTFAQSEARTKRLQVLVYQTCPEDRKGCFQNDFSFP